MSKYYANQTSKTTWSINASKTKIGFIRKNDDVFVAIIGDLKETGRTMAEAFDAVCKAQNRINICGENDVEKAASEIQRQNEIVRKRVAEFNASPLGQIAGGRMVTRKTRVNI